MNALTYNTDEGRSRLRKVSGSCQTSFEPKISEWGNPVRVMSHHSLLNKIGIEAVTGGTETS